MNDTTPQNHSDDAYVERLRAADPAAGSTPDLAALRATVAARAASGEATVDELAMRRARWTDRTRRGWLPAAAAAAVLVLGLGGGYAIGAGQPFGAGASSDLAVAVDDEGQRSAAELTGAGAVDPSGVPEASRTSQSLDSARLVFQPGALSDEPTTARSWAIDIASLDPVRTIAHVARLVGVDGEPREESGDWLVGENDGFGAAVWFTARTASLDYYDPAVDPWACADGGSPSTSELEPCAERDLGSPPSASDAESQFSDLLVAVGLDQAGYEFVGHEDDQYTSVTAELLIDGTRAGISWSATYTGAGLLAMNGTVAHLVDLGDYPVISPADAVARLNDPRFGATESVVAYPGGAVFEDQTAPPSARSELASSGDVPQTPHPGSALPWAVRQVTIDSATLEWAPYTAPDGAVLLAPTYRLAGDDGTEWTVVALADAALDFS